MLYRSGNGQSPASCRRKFFVQLKEVGLGGTTSALNGCGGRSNTKRSTCAPTTACRRPEKACAGTWHSTTQGDRIHRWTGKRPFKHISPRPGLNEQEILLRNSSKLFRQTESPLKARTETPEVWHVVWDDMRKSWFSHANKLG